MRFAAMPRQQQPQRTSAAAEFVRRLVTAPAPVKARPAPARADLPADLDQRVRLVGEW